MILICRISGCKDSIVDILHLHRDNRDQTILMYRIFKVLNVKAAVHDAIVDVQERVLWVPLVGSLFLHNKNILSFYLLFT